MHSDQFLRPLRTRPSCKSRGLAHRDLSAEPYGLVPDLAQRSRLKDIVTGADGVHIHGIWEAHSLWASSAARACKRRYIVSAHGMLEPWALQHKRLKKALYAALLETRVLQHAACLRALTNDEAGDYRRLGFSNPIAVVPNGVDPPPDPNPELFWHEHPELAGRRIVLFLGRIHYKKGLDLLLSAWSRIRRRDQDHLLIAGPDSDGSVPALVHMREELGLQGSVTFTGMLSGDRKWSALAAASLFVLPSRSEGFSMAVLEALAAGLPAIISRPCHFPDVSDRGCGRVIEPTLADLQHALADFLHLDDRARGEFAARGRELVQQRFHWRVVGKQMADVHEWLQGGPRPAHVELV